MTRTTLPQLDAGLFLTDGGLETTLIFHEGLELPHFAAFMLLNDTRGRALLRRYFRSYLQIAAEDGRGFILESPTWRSNPDWGARLGLSASALDAVNRSAIELMAELRGEYQSPRNPIVISGCVGPRGDGYEAGTCMNSETAQAYHAPQIAAFQQAGADMITAITMTNTSEAVGVTRAAQVAGLPVAISFTVETDGRLPTGMPLAQAITEVDALTGAGPAYFMINCAHPTHFADVLDPGAEWTQRIRGLRANASNRSHQELNDSPDLDAGDPDQLGADHARLLRQHPQLCVLGGCCGTDHRHIARISAACRPGGLR